MRTSKKLLTLFCALAVLSFFMFGCDDGGTADGVSSSRFFIPSGSNVTGAVTVSGGFTNTKEQMYWLAEELQDGGIIALAISASNNSSVSGYERAHQGGVEIIQESREIASRLGKIGIIGFSMGGGAVVRNGNEPDVDAVVALAPYTPRVDSGHHAPTMILTGTNDSTAPAYMGEGAYDDIPRGVPKWYGSVRGIGHTHWMTSGSKGAEVDYIVAWCQYYLNGRDSAYDVFSASNIRFADQQFDPGDGGSDDEDIGCN